MSTLTSHELFKLVDLNYKEFSPETMTPLHRGIVNRFYGATQSHQLHAIITHYRDKGLTIYLIGDCVVFDLLNNLFSYLSLAQTIHLPPYRRISNILKGTAENISITKGEKSVFFSVSLSQYTDDEVLHLINEFKRFFENP